MLETGTIGWHETLEALHCNSVLTENVFKKTAKKQVKNHKDTYYIVNTLNASEHKSS